MFGEVGADTGSLLTVSESDKFSYMSEIELYHFFYFPPKHLEENFLALTAPSSM
jgi:hypothetical protein